jgi:hypothetical protein
MLRQGEPMPDESGLRAVKIARQQWSIHYRFA